MLQPRRSHAVPKRAEWVYRADEKWYETHYFRFSFVLSATKCVCVWILIFFSPSFRRIVRCEHESGDAQEQSERNISGYFTFCVYFRSSVSVRLITRFEYDFKQRRATEEKMIVCFTRKFRREFKLKQWNTHEALKVEWWTRQRDGFARRTSRRVNTGILMFYYSY